MDVRNSLPFHFIDDDIIDIVYLPFLGYVLIVSTILSALLMILTFFVTWQMLAIYNEEEKIIAEKDQ